MTHDEAYITAEPIGADQLDRLTSFLRSEDLPDDDVGQPNRHFYFFHGPDETFIGMGGFELYGADALLRSVVTAEEVRGAGHGGPMVELLLNEMRQRGAASAYLLTTTAEGFFARLGFAVIDRDEAPEAIKATREYVLLCPASATVMCLNLSS